MGGKRKRRLTAWDGVWLTLLLLIAVVLPLFLWQACRYEEALRAYDAIPEMSFLPAVKDLAVLDAPPGLWPDDRLFVEGKRVDYRSGQLHLVAPCMEVDDDVMDGTDPAALKRGPGLYAVAQLPGRARDSNTSIAGHRAGCGRYGNLFRKINEAGEGDRLYLADGEWIYVYVYQDTKITQPDDVSVLYKKEYPCLTLTSCHPPGKNGKRMVVTARLEEILAYDENFHYEAKERPIAWSSKAPHGG